MEELSERMDSRELTEWMAYYALEPWGSTVDGYRQALTCATVANAGLMQAAPKTLKKNPFHPKDFLLSTSSKRSQTIEEQKSIMERNMIAHNSFAKRKK